MKYLGVIPARLGSTRLERKPLQTLLNKPLILWVCEAVQNSKKLEKFVVATDSSEVCDIVVGAGFEAQITPIDCASGTDRALEVAKTFEPQIIVNIQGDEPLIKAEEIDTLIDFIESQKQECWATLGYKISDLDLKNPNAVKVILKKNSEAIYFSRFGIPYSRMEFSSNEPWVLKHIGLYAYTYGALKAFCNSNPAGIEKAESLEQLRALYIGLKIFVKETQYESIGVDTMDDLKKVEKILMRTK